MVILSRRARKWPWFDMDWLEIAAPPSNGEAVFPAISGKMAFGYGIE